MTTLTRLDARQPLRNLTSFGYQSAFLFMLSYLTPAHLSGKGLRPQQLADVIGQMRYFSNYKTAAYKVVRMEHELPLLLPRGLDEAPQRTLHALSFESAFIYVITQLSPAHVRFQGYTHHELLMLLLGMQCYVSAKLPDMARQMQELAQILEASRAHTRPARPKRYYAGPRRRKRAPQQQKQTAPPQPPAAPSGLAQLVSEYPVKRSE